jgi:site-specific DNA-methyltransferase (adenine-specific)
MTPDYEHSGITIYHADCRDVLPALDWRPDDLVLTDPPYGTGGWRRGVAGAGSNPAGTLVREEWDAGDVDWLRLVRADVVFTFWPAARTSLLLNAADATRLTKHRALYWRKPDPKPLPGGRTRWSVEPIWVLSRDGFVLYGGDDMVECSALHPVRNAEHVGHPYQKPLKVLRWLLVKAPNRRRVIDPFMGVGSTLVAAKGLGLEAIGIEQTEGDCEKAVRRLMQEAMPLIGTH